MIARISAASNRGNVRNRNEDMVLVGSIMFRDKTYSDVINLGERGTYFAAVADGMGGHQAGDEASEILAEFLAQKLFAVPEELSRQELEQLFTEWIQEAHSTISAEGRKDSGKQGMGTTLVGLLYYYGDFFLVNAGDSRLYLFQDGKLSQLSRDHSLRNLTGRQNIPSNILANSIGAGEEVFVDFQPIEKAIKKGDIFLLCSDGLNDMLDDREIEARMGENGEHAVRQLVKAALAKGGHDNVSVITVEITTTGWQDAIR